MKSTTWLQLVIVGAVLVGCGVGAYATVERLEDSTIHILVGAAAVLIVVLVMGLLFVVKDTLYARMLRRQMSQDNYDDMKQMAMIFKLMGNRAPNVNVKVPEQQGGGAWPLLLQGPQQPQQPYDFDGAYRDTTVDHEIEIE